MSYELTGKIYEIYPTEQKSDRFRKREFIVEKSETSGDRTFTDYVKFQATNDKCDMLDRVKVGDEVKVSFNIKGNRWENRDGQVSYFTNLDAWRVEAGSAGGSQDMGGGDSGYSNEPSTTQIPPESDDDYVDDLPF